MMTLLLQRQFQPYSFRSIVTTTSAGEFTATLCCNGVRVGSLQATRDPAMRTREESEATLLVDFDDREHRLAFESFISRAMAATGNTGDSEAFAVKVLINMMDAYAHDKRIHAMERRGKVVYRLESQDINEFTVIDGPFTQELAQWIRTDFNDLSWIANEEIQASLDRRKPRRSKSLH